MRVVAALLGPTASGKSAVSMIVAEAAGAEIVSVDSMQVYRRMDLGTAKPTTVDRSRVTHHMIDVVDPADAYSVAEFRAEGRLSMSSVDGPLLVMGGSGLHFRSLVDPMDFAPTDPVVRASVESQAVEEVRESLLQADPDAGLHVDLANPRRVVRAAEILRLTGATPSQRAATSRARAVREYEAEVPLVAVGLDPGGDLPGRIEARFDGMLSAGLIEEVEGLVGVWGVTASQAVGYREMSRVVAGEWSLEEGRRRAIEATTALARRQRTYFRRDPRIRWMDWHDDPQAVAARVIEVFEEVGWTS
ncbi:MAG: tRNA (adenosine(37)-N6)-dimethylallyltransferase MiaA [Acidimicrobiia bacterium]